MWDEAFLVKVVVSVVLGGFWVVFATFLGEKFGSKIGGLITGLPSTAIFGLLFLGLTNSASFVVESTSIMPAGIGIENFYIVLFILLARSGLFFSIGVSLVFWFVASYFLVNSGIEANYLVSLLLYVLSTLMAFYITERVMKIRAISRKATSYTTKIILTRGLLGGLMVGSVVVVGKLGGPILGGMASVFPALISSTMIITYLTHGYEFSQATMKSVILGLSGLVIYSLIVRTTYVPMGIFVGTLISVTAAILWSYLLYKLLISKTK